MLSKSNVEKIRKELSKYNDSIIQQKYMGNCQGFARMIYLDCGLKAPLYCCANNDRDHNTIYDDHVHNGDFVFSGKNYHNVKCDVCKRECGHVGIYLDGYVYGAQSPYKCTWAMWKSSFGYGGHSNFNQDEKPQPKPQPKTKRCMQASYNKTSAQFWKLVPVGDYYKIVNYNGQCLDVKGGSTEPMKDGRLVQGWTDNGTDAQLWKLIKNDINNGYFVASKLNEDYVLDVCNGTINKRAYVQLHKMQTVRDSQYAQTWYLFENYGTGKEYKCIVNAKSLMCLDINPTGV